MPVYYYAVMAAVAVGSYFVGNINFSIIISKFKHRDVRGLGSGNPGTMNMLRSFGIKLGILTLFLDALKGAGPALLGWWLLGGSGDVSEMLTLGPDKIGVFVGGFAAVLGHIFPVAFKFHGGKGVATSIGVCFVVAPIVSLIAFAIGVAFFLTVKIGSLTSFIMTGAPLIYTGVSSLLGGAVAVGTLSLLLYAVILAAHHANIARIFRGEEKQIILFGKNKSAKKIAAGDGSAAGAEETSGESTAASVASTAEQTPEVTASDENLTTENSENTSSPDENPADREK